MSKTSGKKAVFLDRDGVLNVDHGYVGNVKDFELMPDVIEGLQVLRDAGYMLFVITNQSGIGRDYYSLTDMEKVHAHMLGLFNDGGIEIEEILFCPHAPEEKCIYRKPGPSNVFFAKRKYDLDLQNSFLIGDKAADIQCANNAGMNSVFMLRGQDQEDIEKALNEDPNYSAANFKKAASYIANQNEDKLVEVSELDVLVKDLKAAGKTIVTLNGAFDVLHEGHAKIVREAKAQGDVLMVGLNADASIRSRKGTDRPINNIRARLLAKSADKHADFVFEFSEETPKEFLDIIQPHVHANGSDYGMDCIERPWVESYGGRIHVVTLIEGVSSTKLIQGE